MAQNAAGNGNKKVFTDDVSLVISGAAGKGILTIINVLTKTLKQSGFHVFATNEYMSRIRGGTNSAEIRVSSKRVSAFINRIDILVPLDKGAIPHLKERITKDTVILGDKGQAAADIPMTDIPFGNIALDLGKSVFENVVAAGTLLGLFGIKPELLDEVLKGQFGSKGEEIVKKNIEAGRAGLEKGQALAKAGTVRIELIPDKNVANELFLNGTEALGIGAISGGCDFISSYPMSPATGVLTFIAQQSKEFDIVIDQAEDEIAAINAGLGAWYAGARAMVTTSGGGFALMTEGVSLSGMIETPIVIHIGQRPGPATGLPTRTEQGDLSFAVYSGHGDFPRIVLAPGTIKDATVLTHKAFNLADRFQIPVFILSDQFFLDSYTTCPDLEVEKLPVERFITKTAKDYKRYKLTSDGISPRGIPGYGEGLVCVDSDEHDETGHITESEAVRNAMMDKRLVKKAAAILKEAIPPQIIGSKDYSTIIVGWGSTHSAIAEAIENLGRKDVAFLYFTQVFPLQAGVADTIKKAKNMILVENNASGQFGKILQLATGMVPHHKILKSSGAPFTVEELVEDFRRLIK
ncbi:MAG TPA: 2-oxoacid:acceptor oxidoreductase subunit alpha [Candidatus Nanoarchaeia archaeon]|nr:2-oxoacid:acceptor oxidoreductase subunit alpha [Candidatus Nanoarchaeia archaeon]